MPTIVKRGGVPQLSPEICEEIRKLPGSEELYDIATGLINLHARKNIDYSGEHPLDNFVWVAAYANTTPRIALKCLCAKSQAKRRSVELHNNVTVNESKRDFMMDTILYHILELALEDGLPDLIDQPMNLVPTLVEGSAGYFNALYSQEPQVKEEN